MGGCAQSLVADRLRAVRGGGGRREDAAVAEDLARPLGGIRVGAGRDVEEATEEVGEGGEVDAIIVRRRRDACPDI